jgi:hypothetical protein
LSRFGELKGEVLHASHPRGLLVADFPTKLVCVLGSHFVFEGRLCDRVMGPTGFDSKIRGGGIALSERGLLKMCGKPMKQERTRKYQWLLKAE